MLEETRVGTTAGSTPSGSASRGDTGREAVVRFVLCDLGSDAVDAEQIHRLLVARMPALEGRLSEVTLDEMATALGRGERMIGVLAAPEHSLSASLATAEDPLEALEEWIARQKNLLALQRRNRRSLTFVDSRLFARSEEDPDWLSLSRRVGGGDLEPAAPLDTVFAPADARFQLAAISLRQTDAEAAEVMAALDATTLGRDPRDAMQVIKVAVQAWRKDQEEIDLLRANLTLQIETTAHKNESEMAALAQAERTAREGQVEQVRLNQRRRDGILGAQLLDEMKRSQDLKATTEALSRELDKVYGTKSWRITAPLRAAAGRMGSASQG